MKSRGPGLTTFTFVSRSALDIFFTKRLRFPDNTLGCLLGTLEKPVLSILKTEQTSSTIEITGL